MSGFRSTDDLNEAFDSIGADYPEIVDADPTRTHLVISPGDVQFEDERPPSGPFRSDWDAMVERHEKAAIGPNGQLVDDFDQNFQIKQAEHGELAEKAPFSRKNPPTASAAMLGGSFQVGQGQQVAACQWNGDDIETTSVTITAGPPGAPSFVIANAKFRPFLILQWGSRGFLFTAAIDIGRGIQMTVNASSVQVGMQLAPIPASPTATLQMAATLSFDACVRTSPLTCTVYVDALASTSIANIVIPNFAKKVSFFRSDATNALSLTFKDYTNTAAYSVAVAANGSAAETPTTPIELSGDIQYIAVQNAGAGATDIRCVFELDI